MILRNCNPQMTNLQDVTQPPAPPAGFLRCLDSTLDTETRDAILLEILEDRQVHETLDASLRSLRLQLPSLVNVAASDKLLAALSSPQVLSKEGQALILALCKAGLDAPPGCPADCSNISQRAVNAVTCHLGGEVTATTRCLDLLLELSNTGCPLLPATFKSIDSLLSSDNELDVVVGLDLVSRLMQSPAQEAKIYLCTLLSNPTFVGLASSPEPSVTVPFSSTVIDLQTAGHACLDLLCVLANNLVSSGAVSGRADVDGLSCLAAVVSCYIFFDGPLEPLDDGVISLVLSVKDKSKEGRAVLVGLLVRVYDKIVVEFERVNGEPVEGVMGRLILAGEGGDILSCPAFAARYNVGGANAF